MSEIVKPRIFITTEVLNIFEKSYSELESIKQNIVNSSIQESWFQKSIYIHIYTVFETTLYQTYRKILTAFPDTLKNQEIKDIGDILSSFSLTTPLVEIAATAFARNFAYGKIEELLKQYNNIVKIGLNITTCDFLEELKQYKDERNILVHNGILSVEINKDKILNKIELIEGIIETIKFKFKSKYSIFTKEHLIKESWIYVFGEALPFECCFKLAKDKGSYIVDKSYIDVRSKTLSSSEKMLLTLFLSNYNSMVLKGAIEIQDLCMFAHLTQQTKNKIGYMEYHSFCKHSKMH